MHLKYGRKNLVFSKKIVTFVMFFTLGLEPTKVSNAEPTNQRFFYVQSGPSRNFCKLASSSIWYAVTN